MDVPARPVTGTRINAASAPQTRPTPWVFDAIGTRWSVECDDVLDPHTARRIAVLVEDFDRAFSRFRPDSLIGRISAVPGVYEIPATGRPLLDFYRVLYETTDGGVTPLVGSSLDRLGYDASYSLRRKGIAVPAPAWDDLMEWDGHTLVTHRPVLLDLGAAGKGRLVDLVGRELQAAGHHKYVVDASGDLVHAGPNTERVGLEHPEDARRVIGVANVSNGALAASAINRRSWGDGLHHVIDPSSGEPVGGTLATWVRADTAMVADGLTTALFLRRPSKDLLPSEFGTWQWVRMATDGSVSWSADFDGQVFQ
jgi:thiamine biosynthesis lipoprotein